MMAPVSSEPSSTSAVRLGVTPPVEVAGMRAGVDLAVRAESLGYTDVWTAEVGAVDAFAPLAAVAVRTERVRLGTGLIPVYTRPPALVAMSAAAIQELSGGRFVLGIGASSPAIVGGWMGMPFTDPVERVEEYVVLVREMLAAHKVSHDGPTVRSDGFRVDRAAGPAGVRRRGGGHRRSVGGGGARPGHRVVHRPDGRGDVPVRRRGRVPGPDRRVPRRRDHHARPHAAVRGGLARGAGPTGHGNGRGAGPVTGHSRSPDPLVEAAFRCCVERERTGTTHVTGVWSTGAVWPADSAGWSSGEPRAGSAACSTSWAWTRPQGW